MSHHHFAPRLCHQDHPGGISISTASHPHGIPAAVSRDRMLATSLFSVATWLSTVASWLFSVVTWDINVAMLASAVEAAFRGSPAGPTCA